MSDTRVNDAKASHNEVRAFGSESYRLFQSALHAVFSSVFPVTLMCAGLTWACQLCAHSAVPTPHLCALLSATQITVSTLFEMASIKCFFFE